MGRVIEFNVEGSVLIGRVEGKFVFGLSSGDLLVLTEGRGGALQPDTGRSVQIANEVPADVYDINIPYSEEGDLPDIAPRQERLMPGVYTIGGTKLLLGFSEKQKAWYRWQEKKAASPKTDMEETLASTPPELVGIEKEIE